MDISQLERFLVLAETGHFRNAAARLKISQPALTHSIKTLERELAAPLFVRAARGVTLTDAGERLLPRARLVVHERVRMAQDVDDLQLKLQSRLTVGVAPYFSRRLFPGALQRLLIDLPELRIEVIEGHSDQLRSHLLEGRIELGFCVLSPSIEREATLEHQAICTERYSVVARKRHPIFARSRASDRELATYPWVVYDSQRTPQMYADLLRARGAAAPSCPISTLSLPLMAAIVANSDHLALMPEDFVWPEVAASRLQRVRGHSLDVTGRGGVVWRRDVPRTETVKKLVKHLRAVCEESQEKARRGGATSVEAMGQ